MTLYLNTIGIVCLWKSLNRLYLLRKTMQLIICTVLNRIGIAVTHPRRDIINLLELL